MARTARVWFPRRPREHHQGDRGGPQADGIGKTEAVIASLALPVALAPGLTLRTATADDLDSLIALLSDDAVSRARGDIASDDDRDAYARGLDEIIHDPNNAIVVASDDTGIRGMLQLTVIPGVARRGSRRLLVEAVRVSSAVRSGGIGTAMMRWVIDVAAPATGAVLIQLTSDAQRADAHRFYTRLGFVDSHVGFKLRV